MSDTEMTPPGFGQAWWSKLSPQAKKDVVRPLIEEYKMSNEAIRKFLGLNTPNQIASQRNTIKKEREAKERLTSLQLTASEPVAKEETPPTPEVIPAAPKVEEAPPPPPKQAKLPSPAKPKKVRQKRKRKKRSVEVPPALRVIENPLRPYIKDKRDRIIEEAVRHLPPPEVGPFEEDPAKDLRYGARMQEIFGRLIEAGVAR